MNSEMKSKINSIIEKTKSNGLKWVQENARTFYTSVPNEESQAIQLSIQFIPYPQTKDTFLHSDLSVLFSKPRYIFQLKNINKKEILYKLEIEKGEEDYKFLDELYASIRDILEKTANKELDRFL